MKKKFKIGISTLLSMCFLLSVVPNTAVFGASTERYLSGVDYSKVSLDGSSTVESDAEFRAEVEKNYDSNYNSEKTALKIGTAGEFAAFAEVVNGGKSFENKFVTLTADIDLGGSGVSYEEIDNSEPDANGKATYTLKVEGVPKNRWTPIGTSDKPFKGVFNGQLHNISNMLIVVTHSNNSKYNGLFGYCNNAELSNIQIDNTCLCVSLGSYDYRNDGALAGRVAGTTTVSCIKSSATFVEYDSTASHDVGNIIGWMSDSSKLTDSTAFGTVYMHIQGAICGGAVGSVDSSSCAVQRVASNAHLCAFFNGYNNKNVGGIVGYNAGLVQSCYSRAVIEVYSTVGYNQADAIEGGLVGDLSNVGRVANSFSADGRVLCASKASSDSDNHYTGGLIGATSGIGEKSITSCFAAVPVGSYYYDDVVNAGALLGGVLSGTPVVNEVACLAGAEVLVNGTQRDCVDDFVPAEKKVDGVDKFKGENILTVLPNFNSSNDWRFKAGEFPILKLLHVDIELNLNTPEEIEVGSKLTATANPANGATLEDTGALTYKWYRDGAEVSSGSNTYTVSQEDKDKTIKVEVTAANYSEQSVSKSALVRILKSNNLTVGCDDVEYGKTPSPAISNGAEGEAVTYQYKANGANDGDYAAEVPVLPGSYIVRATQAANNDYKAGSATASFKIKPKKLGIVVQNGLKLTKTYDGTAKLDLTDDQKALIALDDSEIVSMTDSSKDDVQLKFGTLSYKCANVGTDKEVEFSGFELTGSDADKYVLDTSAIQSLRGGITPKSIGIVVQDGLKLTKTYDGTARLDLTDDQKALIALNDSEIVSMTDSSKDDVQLKFGTLSYKDANVGTDKEIEFSGFELTGSDADKYVLDTSAIQSLRGNIEAQAESEDRGSGSIPPKPDKRPAPSSGGVGPKSVTTGDQMDFLIMFDMALLLMSVYGGLVGTKLRRKRYKK